MSYCQSSEPCNVTRNLCAGSEYYSLTLWGGVGKGGINQTDLNIYIYILFLCKKENWPKFHFKLITLFQVTIFKSCVPIRTICVQIKSTIMLQSIHLNEATIEKYT